MTARTPRNTDTPLTPYPTRGAHIEEKALDLHFHIHDVSFNYPGTYFMKLTIQSLYTNDLSGIRVRTSTSKDFVRDFEVRTELTPFLQKDEVTQLAMKDYHFYLPTGFCRNDPSHDVFVLIQGYQVDEQTARYKRIGEAKFGIYPKAITDIEHDVELGEPMYSLENKLPILRTVSQDPLQMHCGYINYKAVLRETVSLDEPPPEPAPRPPPIILPPSPPPPPPTPPKIEEPPTPSPPPKEADLDHPPLKTPRGMTLRQGKVTDPPFRDGDRSSLDGRGVGWRLLAPEGKEEVSVIVHGATNLWVKQGQALTSPRAYVIGKSKADEDARLPAQSATRAAVKVGPDPSWEELVNVLFDSSHVADEVLILSVADDETRELMTEFRLPISSLEPFHHYHLDMTVPSLIEDADAHLYVTVVRKQNRLPKPPPEHQFVALKVNLMEVQSQLSNPLAAVMAVCSIVTDYPNYKHKAYYARSINLDFVFTAFPNPIPSTFVLPHFRTHGQAQIALPGRPIGKPVWEFPYLFCNQQEVATLFTKGSAILVEYYLLNTMSGTEWPYESPVGYSIIPLDQRTFQVLTANHSGLRVEAPIQGYLRTTKGSLPYANLVLQLMKDKSCADEPLPDISTLPDLVYGQKPPDAEPRPPSGSSSEQSKAKRALWVPDKHGAKKKLSSLLNDDEFPPEDALESILPEYQYIFETGTGSLQAPGQVTAPQPEAPQQPQQPMPSYQQTAAILPPPAQNIVSNPGFTHVHPHQHQVIHPGTVTYIDTCRSGGGGGGGGGGGDVLANTLENVSEGERYREALKRMGGDVLTLRDRVRELDCENSHMRRDMAGYNDASKILLESMDLDGMPKADLVARYVAVKQKLNTVVSELSTYKNKVGRLQNEMIKRNEDVKNYSRMGEAHASQNSRLQHMQDKLQKIRSLEDTVRKQEDIISRMEEQMRNKKKVPNRKMLPPVHESPTAEINQTLLEENRRLRRDLDQMRTPGRMKDGVEETERLELYQLLDKAESRIVSLERQLHHHDRLIHRARLDETSGSELGLSLPLHRKHHHHHGHHGHHHRDYVLPIVTTRHSHHH